MILLIPAAGLYLLYKAYTLHQVLVKGVDGDGIAIYLFFMEINDRVPVEDIPVYLTAFAVTGTLLIISTVLFTLMGKKKA